MDIIYFWAPPCVRVMESSIESVEGKLNLGSDDRRGKRRVTLKKKRKIVKNFPGFCTTEGKAYGSHAGEREEKITLHEKELLVDRWEKNNTEDNLD